MKPGLSLPVSYLAGEYAPVFSEFFGRPEKYLRRLREDGVFSIELRGADGASSSDTIFRAASTVFDSGLEASAHSYLPVLQNPGKFEEIYPELKPFLNLVQKRGGEAVITVHAYVSDTEDAGVLGVKTAAAMREIGYIAEREGLPVKTAVELNRRKGKNDPGASCSSLLEIVRDTGRDDTGICWDFGHCFANVLRGFPGSIPPEGFLERVIHTHIHDVGPDGRTHWPPGYGGMPLEEYVSALSRAGYSGVFNLELNPDRFRHTGRPEAIMEEAVARLKDVLL